MGRLLVVVGGEECDDHFHGLHELLHLLLHGPEAVGLLLDGHAYVAR